MFYVWDHCCEKGPNIYVLYLRSLLQPNGYYKISSTINSMRNNMCWVLFLLKWSLHIFLCLPHTATPLCVHVFHLPALFSCASFARWIGTLQRGEPLCLTMQVRQTWCCITSSPWWRAVLVPRTSQLLHPTTFRCCVIHYYPGFVCVFTCPLQLSTLTHTCTCMYMYIHIHMHIQMQEYTHTCTHMQCTHAHTHM